MPSYEFLCEVHGIFKAVRPMAAYDQPCECPHCGRSSRRVLVTPPQLGTSNRAAIRAHAVNERAADSPKRASERGRDGPLSPGSKRRPSRAVTLPDGSKGYPMKRPWMIAP